MYPLFYSKFVIFIYIRLSLNYRMDIILLVKIVYTHSFAVQLISRQSTHSRNRALIFGALAIY